MAHKTTITDEVYATQLATFKDAKKERRRCKLSHGEMLPHDNAPVHKSNKAKDALRECGFQKLNHPLYNPDLVPSDYFLLWNLKKHLQGQHFVGDNDLMAVLAPSFFQQQPRQYLLTTLVEIIPTTQRQIYQPTTGIISVLPQLFICHVDNLLSAPCMSKSHMWKKRRKCGASNMQLSHETTSPNHLDLLPSMHWLKVFSQYGGPRLTALSAKVALCRMTWHNDIGLYFFTSFNLLAFNLLV